MLRRTILVACVIAILVNTTTSWFTSPRIHRHETKTIYVDCFCEVICREGSRCTWGCQRACGGKKRRSAPKQPNGILLPCTFAAWDVDRSGQIEYEEFAFSSHTKTNDKVGRKLFAKVDVNGDGTLSVNEFTAAPILKEKCCGKPSGHQTIILN